MSLHFQSICSSSGNCLALWSENTRILIDCGLSSMKRTRHVLSSLAGGPELIDSVFLTHTHSDHISYYPLRVLEEYGQRQKGQPELNIDGRDGLGYIRIRWYIFGPPGGTLLLRRLQDSVLPIQ